MSNQENTQTQIQFPAQQELKHLRTRCGKVYALGNNRFRAVVLCFFRSDTDALISTVRTYINYATIVFAAYSGNSVFEKWLTQGKGADAAGDTEEK